MRVVIEIDLDAVPNPESEHIIYRYLRDHLRDSLGDSGWRSKVEPEWDDPHNQRNVDY